MNHHAPVVFPVSSGVGDDDLVLPGQDSIDVMSAFSGEDKELMIGGGRHGPFCSWPDGGVRLASLLPAARIPHKADAGVRPYRAWDWDRPVCWPTRVQGL